MSTFDVVIVGSGPNGLAAGVVLARAGLSVCIYEAHSSAGGGARTEELLLPGHARDMCSAVHPLALTSRFFRDFELSKRIHMLVPEISYASPLDEGQAAIAYRDIIRTADGLGIDGRAWLNLFQPLVGRAQEVSAFTENSLIRWPRNPLSTLLFGLRTLEQGTAMWKNRFKEEKAAALLAGVASHAINRIPSLSAAATALSLGTFAHAGGWPIPRGGSQSIVDAMVSDITQHGGHIRTSSEVKNLSDLPKSEAVIFNTSPSALASIAEERLPDKYIRNLLRYKHGNAAAKVDFILSDPVPWENRELRKAVTLHVGGTRAEMAKSEQTVLSGRHSRNPVVLVSQPSVLDTSRAPAGRHVLWAYNHVPQGSDIDQTEVITAQIERFAPGFRDVIVGSSSKTARDFATYNANYVGGDILSGATSLRQLAGRPVFAADPWRTPAEGIYLASAATPPGPGVHGMGGYHAAALVLRRTFGITNLPSLSAMPRQVAL